MRHLELKPAKAKARSHEYLEKNSIIDDPMWISESKRDGWRFLMHFGGGLDRAYITGRSTSKRTLMLSEKGLCVPCLWPSVEVMGSIGYTVLDGEIESPTNDWRDVAGIMNVAPEDAAKRIAEIGMPTFTTWDILFLDGTDLRDQCLAERIRIHADEINGRLYHPQMRMIRRGPANMEFYDDALARGEEGVVLKNLASAYGDTDGWIKLKKSPTVDLVVTGFTDAKFGVTGKYDGQIGAVRASVYTADGKTLIEIAKVSGMDDATRLDMTKNPEKWIGTVIEVEAQEFSKERLRSPRFKRHRVDVDAKKCSFAKMLFDLAQNKERTEPEQLSLL